MSSTLRPSLSTSIYVTSSSCITSHRTERLTVLELLPHHGYSHNLEAPHGLYRSNARLFREGNELFAELSWLQVMNGQRVKPNSYHPFADLQPKETVAEF